MGLATGLTESLTLLVDKLVEKTKIPTFDIAVLPGDGIGIEIMDACTRILEVVQEVNGGFRLLLKPLDAGASYYQASGEDISQESFEETRAANAILLGAMGLPNIRYPDGTEIAPHLRMRKEFGLFAGVRPVKSYPKMPNILADSRAKDIDVVILRESTEGLFAYSNSGVVEDDCIARDILEITRPNCERFFDFAFELALQRKSEGRPGVVTCVDKANVFRSMAFFRKVFNERARKYPEISTEYRYVDAMALDLVRQPWKFDVLVMENMFGDILSDLGAGIVGGLGLAPCGEIGIRHALFQPAHGSAPDIAGTGVANPTAMFISAAMMLEWLGHQHEVRACRSAGQLIRNAVLSGYEEGEIRPFEFGGTSRTMDIAHVVQRRLRH
jgi:3-isopropylmalate dehydrogenase